MADSIRLQIQKALTAQLEGITPGNGYAYNLAGAVFRGRNVFGDSDPDVMLSILENPRPDFASFAGGGTERSELWPLMIQGWTKDADSRYPTDAVYGLLDAVENQLGRVIATNPNTGSPKFPAEFMLGNLITDLRITPGVVRPPTDGISVKPFFYLPIQVGLAGSLA